jgi:hypothetical protein
MIARFRALLPYELCMPSGVELAPYRFTYGEFEVAIHPPTQALIDSSDAYDSFPSSEVPMREILDLLEPTSIPKVNQLVLMDGITTIKANLFQIDFQKDVFDRSRRPKPRRSDEPEEPVVKTAFKLLNKVIFPIRSYTRSSWVKSLQLDRTYWRLDYLTDDFQSLQPEAVNACRRLLAPFSQ